MAWSDIDGATAASYTPTEDDRGTLLRPNVSYNDGAATGITLVGMASQPVPTPAVVDQPGSVTLSLEGAPEAGTVITATLTDLDGGVTGETWQWQRSADGVTWTDIDGATAASYTATEADAGMQLRALVTYADALGTGISLEGAATEALPSTPEITPTPTMTPTPATTQRPPVRPATPTPTAPPATPTPTAPPDARPRRRGTHQRRRNRSRRRCCRHRRLPASRRRLQPSRRKCQGPRRRQWSPTRKRGSSRSG